MIERPLSTMVFRAALGGMLRAVSRITLVGREHLPATGPLIVVSNHTHNVDPALIGAIMPWRVIYLAKRELVTTAWPIMRWLTRVYGIIPVERERADRSALRAAFSHLGAGGVMGAFPEGTRSATGVIGSAKPGAAYIAVATETPILPVGIDGLTGLGNSPALLLRRPRVTVRIGQPLRLPFAPNQTDRESVAEATRIMMKSIAALVPEPMRGAYGGLPDPATAPAGHGETRGS